MVVGALVWSARNGSWSRETVDREFVSRRKGALMSMETTTSDRVAAPSAERDLLDCDIVMAGGVTSGIIYPGAVEMISRRYAFRSIGGTSVGAIAAAATAAAEYGRRTGSNPQSFAYLGKLPKSLGDVAADGHSRLFHLFTPEPSTRPLLALVTPLFGGGGFLRQATGLLRATLRSPAIAILFALTLLASLYVVISLALTGHVVATIFAIAAAVALIFLVWLGAVAWTLKHRWLPEWRKNGYGICTGRSAFSAAQPSDTEPFEGLTNWMNGVVQAAAGRRPDGPPLTFGDLWSAGTGSAPSRTGARAIELSMIASDISRNRTIQLPFIESPSPIYVEEAELTRYFPKSIVDWFRENRGAYDDRVEGRDGVLRIPRTENIPIAFAARLSLSFPVLLSAFPLMTPDFGGKPAADGKIALRRLWLSDGGLTSNFPVHFFDSPIPAHPTFCLNLVDYGTATEEEGDAADPAGEQEEGPEQAAEDRIRHTSSKPITLPHAESRSAASPRPAENTGDPQPNDPVWGFVSSPKGNRLSPVPFTAFDSGPGSGLLPFFNTLLNTARFWSDNQMLIAPGVRDRVVNIALKEDEGGLNLDMRPDVIADLDRRGRAAGLLISARFDPKAETDPETGERNEPVFARHRWVRYRNFMAAFEDMSRRFARARRLSDNAATMRSEPRLEEMITEGRKRKLGYAVPEAVQTFYSEMTNALEQLALTMAEKTRADGNATFDVPREFGPGAPRAPAGAGPRPKMRASLRPLIAFDPRAENSDLPEPLTREAAVVPAAARVGGPGAAESS